jgi:hypothetical protein
MPRTLRNLLLSSVPLALLVCTASVFLITRASIETNVPATQGSAASQADRGPRNLFLQPDAFRFSRRLGKRFGPSSRAASVITGFVTIDGVQRPVTITRRQTRKGENVELNLAGRSLTWNADEGARAVSSPPNVTERLVIERLTYDSPDYFVLAQLRGASYFTVAQNVRPDNAPDEYDGPVWTVIRVDDPQLDEAVRPASSWRLYYLNSQTGLIDRIVSQSGGETVAAEIVNWSQQSGEKAPSQITWSIGGRVVMSYQSTSVSHNE